MTLVRAIVNSNDVIRPGEEFELIERNRNYVLVHYRGKTVSFPAEYLEPKEIDYSAITRSIAGGY